MDILIKGFTKTTDMPLFRTDPEFQTYKIPL